MNRSFTLALFAVLPLLAQDPHPVVNDDSASHGSIKLSGVNGTTAHAAMGHATAPPSSGFQDVFTRGGSNLRYGVYDKETRLTPAVVASGLHRIGALKMTGDARGMEASPLFAKGVKAGGKIRNMVFCADMANQVWGFDADTYQKVWKVSLGNPVNGSTKIDAWKINDHWGILSTPAISNGYLYAFAWVSKDGTPQSAQHVLFEVRLTDGKVARRLPLDQPGPIQRKQRSALSIEAINGTRFIFIPNGTVQETSPAAHGYVAAIDIDHWKLVDEWNATPSGAGGGIWAAGSGPSIVIKDNVAHLYLSTGNGTFNPRKGDFSESVVDLAFDGKRFSVPMWWTPFMDSMRVAGMQNTMGWDDTDLGSGGVVAIPDKSVVLAAGKDAIAYGVRMDRMGNTQPEDLIHPAANYAKLLFAPLFIGFNGVGLNAAPEDIHYLNQFFLDEKTHHIHSTPNYWNGMVFNWPENGNLRAWKLTDHSLEFVARSSESASYFAKGERGGMPGAMMAISSNGTKDGVLWACVPDGDGNQSVTTGRVFVFDINSFTGMLDQYDHAIKRLWMSDDPPAGHYIYNKFAPPVIDDGRLWVTTYDSQVLVYGPQ